MRSFRALASPVLVAALVAACAVPPERKASWYTRDGKPVAPDAVRAASKSCEADVGAATSGGAYRSTVEWGVAMLDCMRAKGFVLVYENPEELAPKE